MNLQLISTNLQYLRKQNNETQETLAHRLGVSRQAVSKWETGKALPDLELLLRLSHLYQITVNDILEPQMIPRAIQSFEEISGCAKSVLEKIPQFFDSNDLVKASMGASPQVNTFLQRSYPDIDFERIQNDMGRIRIEEIEEIQNRMVEFINLQIAGGSM